MFIKCAENQFLTNYIRVFCHNFKLLKIIEKKSTFSIGKTIYNRVNLQYSLKLLKLNIDL